MIVISIMLIFMEEEEKEVFSQALLLENRLSPVGKEIVIFFSLVFVGRMGWRRHESDVN